MEKWLQFCSYCNFANCISYCEYFGRYLRRISLGTVVNFFDSFLCKRWCKKEANMMVLERSSLFCIHFTESNLQDFKDFKIQIYSEINMKLWVLFSSVCFKPRNKEINTHEQKKCGLYPNNENSCM